MGWGGGGGEGAGEMIQQVKVPVAKADDLSLFLIPTR